MLQQWLASITTPRTGPRGGKAKPIIERYIIAAESREAAMAALEAEQPAQLQGAQVTISETQCLVWRAA